MKLKKLSITNYRCYYGTVEFDFDSRLTLILGDNGEGKTTFFEALEWLLEPQRINVTYTLDECLAKLSERARSRMSIGDEVEVAVSLEFSTGLNKNETIEKKITIKKLSDTDFDLAKANEFIAWERTAEGRRQVDPDKLIEDYFPPMIKNYSMFKGEHQLSEAFNDKISLSQLIGRTTSIADFDKVFRTSEDLLEQAKQYKKKEESKDKKNQTKYRQLDEQEEALTRKRDYIELEIENKKGEIQRAQRKLEELQKFEEKARAFGKLSGELTSLGFEIEGLKKEEGNFNLNIKLLDNLWILKNFDPIFSELKRKSADWDAIRTNELNKWRDKKSFEEGRQEGFRDLMAWNVPGEATLEKMLEEHKCAICGTAAPTNSLAFINIKQRLERFREYQNGRTKRIPDNPFKTNFTGEISDMVRSLEGTTALDLSDELSSIDQTVDEYIETTKRLRSKQEEFDKKNSIIENFLAQEHVDDPNKLTTILQDIKTLTEIACSGNSIEEYEEQLAQVKADLRKVNEERDDLSKGSKELKECKLAVDVLGVIKNAIHEARETNANAFVSELNQRANQYLSDLRATGFSGVVRLTRQGDKLFVNLFDNSGTVNPSPSRSEETLEYMSVLFAISSLLKEKSNQSYPLIFDAPTSSFGQAKEFAFYRTISTLDSQCVVLTKDLITQDGLIDREMLGNLDCKIYRIQTNKEILDKNDRSTIEILLRREN